MNINNFLCYFLILILFSACSNKDIKKSTITEKDLESQVVAAYKEGMEALEGGDVLFAAQKFNEVETLFPQSELAPKSALMAAYSYYKQDYYSDAIDELKRFTRVYPKHKNLDYAYYLLAICYYEQIVDEKKDLESIMNAKEIFVIVVSDFPNTEYSIDARYKLDLIDDILAAKEMYIGRYYFEKKKWAAAINRFRTVVDDYETTIYTQEALHRLVEIYYTIGLSEEAKKYASLLGYNYQSSSWYESSYKVFNKNYEIKKKEREESLKKKNKKFISKFKSLFN
tara:strand:- start:2780 stop:3628 length:849 start_codon:yes stop_codon:yes gene_type:complete